MWETDDLPTLDEFLRDVEEDIAKWRAAKNANKPAAKRKSQEDIGGEEPTATGRSVRRANKTIITSSVAAGRFHTSRTTLRRHVREGRLTDHRPSGHPSNAPLLLDEEELATRFPRKGT